MNFLESLCGRRLVSTNRSDNGTFFFSRSFDFDSSRDDVIDVYDLVFVARKQSFIVVVELFLCLDVFSKM